MSKKISLIILAVILVLAFILPSSTVLATSDKKVKSVDTTFENGKLTVTGEVEEGMLAVAVQIYGENDNLIKLETGAVDSDNTFKVEANLQQTPYLVKVADFDGGEVVVKNLNEEANVKEEVQEEVQEETKTEAEDEKANTSNNPATGDNIMTIISVFAIATLGVFITVRTNKKFKNRK